MRGHRRRRRGARPDLVKAFVVLRPPHVADEALVCELQEFVKAAIAPYEYPCTVEFCASLPRAESGKLQRFRLRTP
jgi:2-aminobenzoate-CoA ligase